MQLSALTYLSSISFPRGRLDGTRRRGKFPPTGGRATGRKCGGGFYLAPRNPKSFGISTLPIPANRPNSDQNSHLGRAQLHREGQNVTKKGADSKRCGSNARNYGAKFRPSGCGGHKNSENAATFSEFLGQEDKLSPAPRRNRQQPTTRARTICVSRPEIRKALAFSPSQDRITLPIPANRPNTDHNSHLGRAQPHREGENVARLRRSGLLGVGNGKAPRKHLGGAARLRMPGSVQQQKPANWRSQIRLRSGDKRLRWFLCR